MILQRLIVFGLVLAGCTAANAAVVHRYSFSGNVDDSVGIAHGTLMDAGAATAVFASGVLDVSANTGQGSNSGISEDAWVDLPNGIFSAAASGGTAGQMTIEIWAKAAVNNNWAALLSAGTSNGGEGSSSGGNTTDYIQVIPRAGADGNDIRTTTHAANQGAEGFVDYTSDLSTTAFQHIVSVYDQSGGLPGTLTLYVDGGLVGSTSIATSGVEPDINLSTFTDNNNWLGRSQWPDPVFDGFFDEVRIHNMAVSAGYVADAFRLGSDRLVPEPTSVVLLVMAAGAIAAGRRARSK